MPVTIKINPDLAAEPYNDKYKNAPTTAREALFQTASGTSKSVKELLQTSIKDSELPDIICTSNGFVHGCLQAYNQHHNLVIRPDDVWITVMAQFAVYVDKNNKKMREYFVGGREGKKHLIVRAGGWRYSVDFGAMAEKMASLLEDNLVDKELKNWIIPSFTTTTTTDRISGSILLMASMKNYFSYEFQTYCGLPSVTLDGTKEDWEDLSKRLDKLLTFGDIKKHPHLHAWHGLLKPIITHFVDAFDAFTEPAPESPRAQEIINFFQHICSIVDRGSGPRYISGWLAFFCAFSKMGEWQLHPIHAGNQYGHGMSPAESVILGKERGHVEWMPQIGESELPPGYGEVDVRLDDNGAIFETTLVAGMAGYRVAGEKRDTIMPVTGWWYYIRHSEEEMLKQSRKESGVVRNEGCCSF